jgi:hypothetical protein
VIKILLVCLMLDLLKFELAIIILGNEPDHQDAHLLTHPPSLTLGNPPTLFHFHSPKKSFITSQSVETKSRSTLQLLSYVNTLTIIDCFVSSDSRAWSLFNRKINCFRMSWNSNTFWTKTFLNNRQKKERLNQFLFWTELGTNRDMNKKNLKIIMSHECNEKKGFHLRKGK